jgi:TonB dependent receptor
LYSSSDRAISQTHVDGVWARGRQEITFGLAHRRGNATERIGWPGDQTITEINVAGLPTGIGLARLTRGSVTAGEAGTLGFYAGNRLTADRWSLSAGLRFDRQDSRNLPSIAAANGLLPEQVPSLEYSGGPSLTWNVLSPRVAANYRLSDRTILRASYAIFGSQLEWQSAVAAENPAQPGLPGFIEYRFADVNGNRTAQLTELLQPTGFVSNINPADPGAVFSPNQVDPELSAPTVQSIVGRCGARAASEFLGRSERRLWSRGQPALAAVHRFDE